MVVNIGDRPQADFSQPLELLRDCHRRIEKFLGALQKVAEAGQTGPLDEAHRTALRTALDYFQYAAPRHNEDEEVSLLEALVEAGRPETPAAMNTIQRLAGDHRRMREIHRRIDDLGRRWLAQGGLGSAERCEWAELVEALGRLYPPHIAVEEQELFPTAARILDRAALDKIGQQMHQRRRANPGRPDSRCAARRQAEWPASERPGTEKQEYHRCETAGRDEQHAPPILENIRQFALPQRTTEMIPLDSTVD